MRPPECPECATPRHGLYYCWRRTSGVIEETWGCSGCYRIGPWRLATFPVLEHVERVSFADLPGRHNHRPQAAETVPTVEAPPGAVSREQIRHLFTDLEETCLTSSTQTRGSRVETVRTQYV